MIAVPEVPRSIDLSLVSHTNAGKTTLARTLLRRDVGSVRDAPHVTEFADAYTMVETPSGESLRLWDTPGFGDSLRLARRLRRSANPFGWFMTAVWDRWRDRAFWSTQQALRNVRDEADVMLYLVNAAEEPAAAGYVQPEMELLAWTGKPVIVLLNQLGAPRAGALEDDEVQRWRRHLQAYPQVAAVLPLDAFARCWVQEYTLLRAITNMLVGKQRELMQRLSIAWQSERLATFDAAMRSLALSLARSAAAFELVPEGASLRQRLRGIGARLGIASAEGGPVAIAQQALAERLDAEVRDNTLELLRLHGLAGEVQHEILARIATHFQMRLRLDEGQAALWGGALTGAVAGLKADLLSGGLTLGGGLLAGGLLGALGGAGIARGVNLVRGTGQSWLSWNAAALNRILEAALLRYLAVAHFGRGRGDWAQGESPPHWQEVIDQALAPHRDALDALWTSRSDRHSPIARVADRAADAATDHAADRAGDRGADHGTDRTAAALAMATALQPMVRAAVSATLQLLYPRAMPIPDAPIGETAPSGRSASR